MKYVVIEESSNRAARIHQLIAAITQRTAELLDTYEYVGLRTTDEPMDCADLDQRSRVWLDGDPTGDYLNGLCATDCRRHLGTAIKLHITHDLAPGHYGYCGGHTYIVAGNYASWGEDLDELVIVPSLIERIGG